MTVSVQKGMQFGFDHLPAAVRQLDLGVVREVRGVADLDPVEAGAYLTARDRPLGDAAHEDVVDDHHRVRDVALHLEGTGVAPEGGAGGGQADEGDDRSK